jgi:hypothetical protein
MFKQECRIRNILGNQILIRIKVKSGFESKKSRAPEGHLAAVEDHNEAVEAHNGAVKACNGAVEAHIGAGVLWNPP